MECEETSRSRPCVVIVGAGMAGLAAAQKLIRSVRNGECEVIVLEGSDRIGGRIWTTEFAGERMELGATWIHGIEGNPLFDIAELSGALKGDKAWECMNGFPAPPIVKTEGGFVVDHEAVVEPVMEFYKSLISEAQNQQNTAQKLRSSCCTKAGYGGSLSLGAFLRRRLNEFLHEQERTSETKSIGSLPLHSNGEAKNKSNGITQDLDQETTLRFLLEGVFSIQENSERSETAADSLFDVDLPSFGEYLEFPGKHITIAKGFSSLIRSLSSLLPPETIKLGKVVQAIYWTERHSHLHSSELKPVQLHCQDGSIFQADHVIITVSLGVLKAGIRYSKGMLGSITKLNDPIQENGTHGEGLFQPPLPPWKIEAIQRLGFGTVDKVFTVMKPTQGDCHSHMQFIYKSISDKGITAIPSWMRKTFSIYPIHPKSHILLAWFAGQEALEMEELSDDEIARGIETTLSEFGYSQKPVHVGNGVRNSPIEDHELSNEGNGNGHHSCYSIRHSKWGSDPLFLGSYSYIAAGSSGEDFDIMAEPVPKCHDYHIDLQENCERIKALPALQLLFAGEATHRFHYSTTHGAYFSGLREADRLLSYYGLLT